MGIHKFERKMGWIKFFSTFVLLRVKEGLSFSFLLENKITYNINKCHFYLFLISSRDLN